MMTKKSKKVKMTSILSLMIKKLSEQKTVVIFSHRLYVPQGTVATAPTCRCTIYDCLVSQRQDGHPAKAGG